jgi:molecular chaperone DnaK
MGSRVIGIDLGTSASLVAVMDGGEPRLIADEQGRTVMPSLVVIKEDRSIKVGHDAESEARKYSDKNLLIASLKRSMGKHKEYGWHDSSMPVQVLAAIILAELKIRAEMYLGERVEKAVIAVPAHFSFSQRQFTKEAALIAGLQPVRIVNEATASMLVLRDRFEGEVVTADLGGGTFDVSAMTVARGVFEGFVGHGVFEVVATAGAERLGGDDFTAEVSKLILANMGSQFDPQFMRSDPITSQRLIDAAEDAKKQLSSAEAVEVKIPFVPTRSGTYETLVCTVTRNEFETVCHPLFEEIMKLVDRVCSESRFRAPPISARSASLRVTRQTKKRNWLKRLFFPEKYSAKNVATQVPQESSNSSVRPAIWLIGNASRVPEIRRRLEYKYRMWHPPGVLGLKEPVALGAAKIAGILEGTVKESLLLDATPNTLGIETTGGITSPIIPRNTTIPTRKSHLFTTVDDNQTSISVTILEGERPLSKDNRILGMLQVDDLPMAPAGIPKIEVCFEVDANGLLRVRATDGATKKTTELQCSELVLPEKQLNEYHSLVQKWIRQRRAEDEV